MIIIIIGGGFGSKDDLPSVISSLNRPVLFAHRGVTTNYPDNSRGSVMYAKIKGFTGVELDVQFSSDSTFFIHHDKDIYFPNDTNLTANKLTISKLPIPAYYKNEQTEMLALVPKLSSCTVPYKFNLIFYFDMKRYGHDSVFELARDIAKFIKEHNLEQTTLVASAHVLFISYLEYNHPEIITVMEGIHTENPWLYNLIPKKFKPDMIASRQATINDDFVQWLKDNNMLSRYIVYHGDELTFQTDLDRGIEMFIVDYAPYLDNYLNPDSSFLGRR